MDLKSIISVRARDSASVNNSITNIATKKPKRTLREVQHIAHKLEAQLGKSNPSRFNYFCKVAWHLPESKIWAHAEAAVGPGCKTTPTQLFIWLCETEPEMQ